jgi:hypothetical protein
LVAAALACAAVAGAQEPAVRATVDRATVRENESFTYTIRAEGNVRGEPETGPLEQQFDVLDRGTSSRIQIVNGQTSQITEWQFQLMPKAPGDYTVPALRVGPLTTNAVALKVVPPDGDGDAPADVFMELAAEPSTVYVQSQVVVTVRLFIGISTGRATLTQPEISGAEAIVERLGEDSQYQTMRGGRSFIVRERRYAVFPQRPGALTVGPVTFEAMVIPDRGFSRVQRFRSTTLELDVQPAVPPPPEQPNAAWLPAQRVTLRESSGGEAELVAGIPWSRTITIEADGLLETQLPDVAMSQQPGVRQYANQPELDREVTPQGLRARRSVTLAVIAQTPGELTLDAIEVPWWNVAEGRWEVATLPARTLQVTPSAEAVAPPAAPASEPRTVAAAPPPPSRDFWPYVSLALAVGWALTAALWWRAARPPRGTVRLRTAGPSQSNERRLLRELKAACTAGEAEQARRALLQWARLRFAATPPRSLGALAPLLPSTAARPVLELEAHIYGSAAGPWDGAALAAVLPELARGAGAGATAAKEEPLLPLYR